MVALSLLLVRGESVTAHSESKMERRLRDALKRYGRHRHDCNYAAFRRAMRAADANGPIEVPCTCGWEHTAKTLRVSK